MNQQAKPASVGEAPAADDTIVSARITAMPKSFLDPMPQVHAKTAAGVEHLLFEYYPDELSFTPSEFVGLTLLQGRRLKFDKDRAFLRS